MPRGAVLWDFDRTLATRVGGWAACAIEVLDELEPGHAVTVAAVWPFLQNGFPWHTPNVPHPELSTADRWWAHVDQILAKVYEGVGFDPSRASALADAFRAQYLHHRPAWRVSDGAVSALSRVRGLGWRNVILSNHVPELPTIVESLGIAGLVDAIVNSGVTGYEKPHPRAFELAREAAGAPLLIWMVGDNYAVDVLGAEAVGIPAVLLLTDPDASGAGEKAARTVSTLDGALDLIALTT